MDKKFTLTFTEKELNLVFAKLCDAPFKEVAGVIGAIQQQLAAAVPPNKIVPDIGQE